MSKITISKRTDSSVGSDGQSRHRLRAWVSETTNNIPEGIFVYQKIPSVPMNTDLEELFVHIASYADILDYPEECPGEDSPFFRRYYIDLTFDSLAVLNEKWNMMKGMINHTVEDIVRLNNLEAVELIELDVSDAS